jgi:hypothetical protein
MCFWMAVHLRLWSAVSLWPTLSANKTHCQSQLPWGTQLTADVGLTLSACLPPGVSLLLALFLNAAV